MSTPTSTSAARLAVIFASDLEIAAQTASGLDTDEVAQLAIAVGNYADSARTIAKANGRDFYACAFVEAAASHFNINPKAPLTTLLDAGQVESDSLGRRNPEPESAAPNDLERLAAEFQELRAKGVSGPLADDVVINGVSYVVSIDTEEEDEKPGGPLWAIEQVWVVEGGPITQQQVDDDVYSPAALGQTEWSVSDGPPDARSYSEDYASFEAAMAAALALPKAKLITVDRLLGDEA